MSNESKKLDLIEKILQIDNDELLSLFDKIIADQNKSISTAKNFRQFGGKMTKEEVENFEKIIEDGCENINPDNWK